MAGGWPQSPIDLRRTMGCWLFGFPHLGISVVYFLALEALMAAILLIIAQYKANF
jgi:hypothetical protein